MNNMKTKMMKSNAFPVDSVQTSAPAQTTPSLSELGIGKRVVQKTGNDIVSNERTNRKNIRADCAE